MHLLQIVYLRLCQHYELADQTHGRETTPEVGVAFQSLKETLCTAPVLAYTQPGETLTIDTDASRVSIGGVLSQVQDR
jgi:hypothetical protein